MTSADAIRNTDGGWALFLDFDGTLVEIADKPQNVHVSEDLKQLVDDARHRVGGALAIVSGRSIASLDRLLSPFRFLASGIHGCERRTAEGITIRPEVDAERIAKARAALGELVRQHPGLLLEDKGYSLAVHYRLAPEMQSHVRSAVDVVLAGLGPDFVLQAGKSVLELRPGSWSKGTSVAAFMKEAPFRGRTPIYIGDDVTDEDAFEVVNDLHGLSIRVGAAGATLAQHRLANVGEVLKWLSMTPPAIPPQRVA
jgi:trehalose 6-phosphate phosphatase